MTQFSNFKHCNNLIAQSLVSFYTSTCNGYFKQYGCEIGLPIGSPDCSCRMYFPLPHTPTYTWSYKIFGKERNVWRWTIVHPPNIIFTLPIYLIIYVGVWIVFAIISFSGRQGFEIHGSTGAPLPEKDHWWQKKMEEYFKKIFLKRKGGRGAQNADFGP